MGSFFSFADKFKLNELESFAVIANEQGELYFIPVDKVKLTTILPYIKVNYVNS